MKLRSYLSLVPFVLCAWVPARGEIAFATVFTDHAVLQRGVPIPVWGRAQPGEHISVAFHGVTGDTVTTVAGTWQVKLPALSASSTGEDLTVSAAGEAPVVLHDVVVGEVWLCSGQSNMEFQVNNPRSLVFRVQNAQAEVAAADFPLIRQYTTDRVVSNDPSVTTRGSWEVCSPKTAGMFTAAGYFFARDIYRRLGVPIGIIDSTWGGTAIESWMSREALAGDPAFAVVNQRWEEMEAKYPALKPEYDTKLAAWNAESKAQEAAGGKAQLDDWRSHHPAPRLPPGARTGDQWMPSGLFNGMIYPLIPYGIRGFLWYQGEANASWTHAKEYHRLFAAMITQWRADFGQGDLPFYWVQLASYANSGAWPYLREAQQQTLSLPATGQALAIDIGELGNIHPRNKQEVGRRLALLAAHRVYGISVADSGPMFAGAVRDGAAMRVRFTTVAEGLRSDQPVATCELAGADHKFYPAAAQIEGDTLVVRSAQVPAPIAVRYAFKPFAEGHLANSAGLPAAPFRSDSW